MASTSQIGEIGGFAPEDPDVSSMAGISGSTKDLGGEQVGDPAAVGFTALARTASDALKDQASQLAQGVSEELSKSGESQKQRGVDALRRFARAIDTAADEIQEPVPTIARSVHEVAKQIDGFSDSLADRNVNELIDQAAQMARAQPALFLGGSVVAGFALARFLWSSGRGGSAPPHGNLHQS